jgi:hypothetical protein
MNHGTVKKLGYRLLLFLMVNLPAYSQDQLHFENGDVLHGVFLRKVESLIYFDSTNFGVMKIPAIGVEVVRGTEENKETLQDLPVEDSTLPAAIEPELDEDPIDRFWQSAELTLEKIVNDKVPSWFPVLPDGWLGSLRMGIDVNDAATNTNRYSGEFRIEGNIQNYNVMLETHATYAETAGTASEDDWGTTLRGRYLLKSKDFLEIQGSYEEDDLNNPKERLLGSVGFGISPNLHDSITLDLVGGGALERTISSGGVRNRSFSINFNENFTWRFNDHLTLTQMLQLFVIPEETLDYYARFSAKLDTLILGSFVLGVGYKLDYETQIDDPDQRLRTRFTTSLGINF